MGKSSIILTAVMTTTMVLGFGSAALAEDSLPGQSKKVLLGNDQVLVLEVRSSPGTKVPMRTHPPGVLGYYLSPAKVKATLSDGKTKTVDIPAGRVFWYPDGLEHAIEIVGTTDQHVLVIQLKK